MARSKVNDVDVQAFKKAWYNAVLTGKYEHIQLDKGRRDVEIKSTTQPQEVGITDPIHIESISAFKNLVGTIRLIGMVSGRRFIYLDETALNVLDSFREEMNENIDEQLVVNLIPCGGSTNDVRISPNGPVVLVFVQLDKEKVKQWMLNAAVLVTQEIGGIDVFEN